MSDQGPWVTKTILELEERVAELTEEIEHLQDLLIRQGDMLSAIVNITKGLPKANTLHSTHDAVESVERLQARVAELEGTDFILRTRVEAVEAFVDWVRPHWPTSIAIEIDADSQSYVFELRKMPT